MKKNVNELEVKERVEVVGAEEATAMLEQYRSQNEEENDDIHFEHYDWTYNDGSCCC